MLKYLGLFVLVGFCQAISKYYMDTNCGKSIDIDQSKGQIKLDLTKRSSYQPNLRCNLTINATTPDDRLMLYFRSMSIRETSRCDSAWLDVRDGNTQRSPYVSGIGRKLCGDNMNSVVFHTTGRALFLYFVSDNSHQSGGFQMIITPYHTGACSSDEYKCDNRRCINDDIRCCGYNPCGDHSDCPLAAVLIACIVIGCIAFTALVVVCIVCIVCRRRRRSIRYTVVKTNAYGSTGYN